MATQYDLVIRQGLIVDGSGGAPIAGDVAIKDGRIAAIGQVDGSGAEEIDAKGLLVTPGFVDVHTHYDGQAIWSERMVPSSNHGVTTVVMGNCGVGFAPCRAQDRDLLINAMEGVEDIPGVVMVEGLTWEWESFPEFLDALDKRPHDIDVAAYIPHSALRVYVMGDRGANREPATDQDIEQMVALVRTAMQAGAAGFATSRLSYHRRIDGEFIPSFEADERELTAIAIEVGHWGGIFQLVPELAERVDEDEAKEGFELLRRISRVAGVPITFTMAQNNEVPTRLADVVAWVAEANKEPGVSLRPQLFPRPVGMVIGHELSANPFMDCATYRKLAALPIDERVAELRKPEVRAQILSETPDDPTLPLMRMSRLFDKMFPMGENPNYEPDPNSSVEAVAAAKGVTPSEVAYDLLLEQGGRATMLIAMANYATGSLDHMHKVLLGPDTIIALGDGGAHYGLICDASYPTFMLSHWARDRKGDRFSVEATVRALSSVPAGLLGLEDRGLLEVGRRADINVIDIDTLRVHSPTVAKDLPAGGKRLHQGATGYRATIVNGRVIQRDGKATDELPGKLIRFARKSPAAAAKEAALVD